MEKYYFEKEWREAVLLTKENKPTVLALNGEEVEIYCPEIGRRNVSDWGTPCIVSEGKSPDGGGYSVMDFSLDSIVTENKGWICLQPIVFEEVVGFFLANHHMEELVGVSRIEDEKRNLFS